MENWTVGASIRLVAESCESRYYLAVRADYVDDLPIDRVSLTQGAYDAFSHYVTFWLIYKVLPSDAENVGIAGAQKLTGSWVRVQDPPTSDIDNDQRGVDAVREIQVVHA